MNVTTIAIPITVDGAVFDRLPKAPLVATCVLRHGAGVEVLAPPALRARVAEELAAAASQYE